MFTLLITMVERLGILVMIAFIFTRFRFFRDMIYQDKLSQKQQYTAICFFGFFGIIGTYSGLTLSTENLQFDLWATNLNSDEAIANSRVIGVVLAGLLGGYKVGIGAGLIAGIHRFTLGGFTAIACGLATIISGIISGIFYKKNKLVKLKTAFFIGFLAEALQMLIIILVSRPVEKAIALVEIIGMPMIIANGLGCALFLLIIKTVINEEEKAGALLAQKTLRIAEKTLSHLRNGLTYETAKEVCSILHKEIHTSAVAITNSSDILAHVGQGEDHHQAGIPIQTQITMDTIQKGEIVIANRKLIHCRYKGCPLDTVVIAPLKLRGSTIGTLKLYFRSEKEVTPVIIELIRGISSLLSNQLEIANADKAYQLAREAEIKVLQAQISPHFLFNSLNTILSLIRVDPMKARKLLVFLSKFLRQNLAITTEKVTTLDQELKHVEAYLAIEEARFINKLKVVYEIDEESLRQNIPPLTLQPLVENSIKHGMKDKEENFILKIHITKETDFILVRITDNGSGIEKERIEQLTIAPIHSEIGNGLALYNVNRRLTMLFGNLSSLQINSEIHKGTEVYFSIPCCEVKANVKGNKSSLSG